MAEKPVNFAAIDMHAADPKEATLELETHARLEAGLINSFSASDPVGATSRLRHRSPRA